MGKKWLVTAVAAALFLSACGNQAGAGEGSSAGSSVPANADGAVNTGDPAMENMSAGTADQGSGVMEMSGSGTVQPGTSGMADGAAGMSGSGTVHVEASGSADGAAEISEPEAAQTGISGQSGQDGETVAQQEGSAGTIRVILPEGWTYDLCPEGSEQLRGAGSYGIHFYPEGVSEGFIELLYTEFFGVCGTGLEEEEMNLAGNLASVGIYDNHEYWDFVSFRGANKGIVALSFAGEDWRSEDMEQTLEILDTVSLIQDKENGTGDICYDPAASQAAGTMSAIACGTNQEPEEGSVIEELGLSLEITEHTGTEATLVFRQSGGKPTGELQYGSDFSMERYEDGEWVRVPVAVEGNYAFTSEAYIILPDEDREFQIDWEWLYGELEPGEYRIVKSVDDFRKAGDYDQYRIYAYFEIYS